MVTNNKGTSRKEDLFYCIQPNYRTYPYKGTVKKFRSLQMQFKWVPTTYAFVKKVRKNRKVIIK